MAEPEKFLQDRVALFAGDCIAILPTLAESSVDAVVTDPPYHLTSIVDRYAKGDAKTENSIKLHGTQRVNPYMRGARGFMNKEWDGGDVAFRVETWLEVLRVMKPGAHLVAFGGTRTFARMSVAIEDAGFEIRDTIMWIYGSGFPKSHSVRKGIERAEPESAAATEWEGWGTALKPACEPIVLARKPLSEATVAANVLKWRTGALNIHACRVASDETLAGGSGGLLSHQRDQKPYPQENGYTPSQSGRWPGNVVHDGSHEVVDTFPAKAAAFAPVRGTEPSNAITNVYGARERTAAHFHNDSGSAARFFYTAKADADDRLGSKHPTVKPLDLIQWLARLVTPPGGLVLDPFAGTGTSAEAAWREGFSAAMIEREPEYQADIRRRMALCLSGPDERGRESIKAKLADRPADHGPLFGGTPE